MLVGPAMGDVREIGQPVLVGLVDCNDHVRLSQQHREHGEHVGSHFHLGLDAHESGLQCALDFHYFLRCCHTEFRVQELHNFVGTV